MCETFRNYRSLVDREDDGTFTVHAWQFREGFPDPPKISGLNAQGVAELLEEIYD